LNAKDGLEAPRQNHKIKKERLKSSNKLDHMIESTSKNILRTSLKIYL